MPKSEWCWPLAPSYLILQIMYLQRRLRHTLKFIAEGVIYQTTLAGHNVGNLEVVTECALLFKDCVAPDLLVLDDMFMGRRISDAPCRGDSSHRASSPQAASSKGGDPRPGSTNRGPSSG